MSKRSKEGVGLLDLKKETLIFTMPWGRVRCVASERGLQKLQLFQGRETFQEPNFSSLKKFKKWLENYSAHKPLPVIVWEDFDFEKASSFDQKVWKALLKVPYGTVVSYKELARRIGKPKAARAVGGAVGRNPIPFLIPCHRVIASDGSLGGFSLGLDLKKKLLAHESGQ